MDIDFQLFPDPSPDASSEEECSESVYQLSELHLHRQPSCISFLPAPNIPNYLVVGSYQLVPAEDVDVDMAEAGSMEQRRDGSLTLLKCVKDELYIVDTMRCPSAVYDLHFLPGAPTIFAAASSTGTISFYYVSVLIQSSLADNVLEEAKIVFLWSAQVFSPTTLITFFEFIPAQSEYSGPLIAATANDGGTYLMSYCLDNYSINLLNDGKPITQHRFLGRPDYAWCCASYFNQTFNLFSGADGGDLVQETIPISNGQLQFDDRVTKLHDYHAGGVTAILTLPDIGTDTPALILTGSYDESIRLYSVDDKRVLAKLNLGGGVYRLKYVRKYPWHDGEASYIILACCMRAGTKIIQLRTTSLGWTFEVAACLGVPYFHGENYCYAADVQLEGEMVARNSGANCRWLFLSGTFVDTRLVLWEFVFKVPEKGRSLLESLEGLD